MTQQQRCREVLLFERAGGCGRVFDATAGALRTQPQPGDENGTGPITGSDGGFNRHNNGPVPFASGVCLRVCLRVPFASAELENWAGG